MIKKMGGNASDTTIKLAMGVWKDVRVFPIKLHSSLSVLLAVDIVIRCAIALRCRWLRGGMPSHFVAVAAPADASC